jgi:glyoxylase-like metal-dependent hydrolase (beta-lactamase superfamily II)
MVCLIEEMPKRRVAALNILALLAAGIVIQSVPASAQVPKAAVSLYTMDCGQFFMPDWSGYSDEGRFDGTGGIMTNPCYLIKHDSEYLLWDTGAPEVLASNHQDWYAQGENQNEKFAWKLHHIYLTMQRSLTSQLNELHLRPADIHRVAISHLDLDHSGNLELFQKATLYIDEREYPLLDDMHYLAATHSTLDHFKAIRAMKVTFAKHELPFDIFGDGTVVTYPASGHTPGHRVLFVKLAEAGPIILAGDLYHLKHTQEWHTVPKVNAGGPNTPQVRAEYLASEERVDRLAAEAGAHVIKQHVPDDFYILPLFPKPLH